MSTYRNRPSRALSSSTLSSSTLQVLSLLILACHGLVVFASEKSPQDLIAFEVTGFKSSKGSFNCGLFTAEGWLETAVASAEARIESGKATCEFPDVAAGEYAVSAYHDENGNGQLDLGFMRIPKEPTVASNNARSSFGPPKFKKARFTYSGGRLELRAEIQ